MNKDGMNYYYKKLLNNEETLSRQVGWRDELAQKRRFQQLYNLFKGERSLDVADLGCGLASFYSFLSKRRKNFIYTGYDMSVDMVEGAKKLMLEGDDSITLKHIVRTEDMASHDYVISSGIFNMKRETSDNQWLNYILDTLEIIDKKSNKGFSFNLLTSYSDKELKKDELYYASPSFFFDYCKMNFAKNVALLHDYEEYDFTVIVRK